MLETLNCILTVLSEELVQSFPLYTHLAFDQHPFRYVLDSNRAQKVGSQCHKKITIKSKQFSAANIYIFHPGCFDAVEFIESKHSTETQCHT